jgi:hypothetical protein
MEEAGLPSTSIPRTQRGIPHFVESSQNALALLSYSHAAFRSCDVIEGFFPQAVCSPRFENSRLAAQVRSHCRYSYLCLDLNPELRVQ